MNGYTKPAQTVWDGSSNNLGGAALTTQYFSLDRRGFYKVGGTLELFKQNPLPNSPIIDTPQIASPIEVEKHIESLFPEGLSLHGWSYMTCPSLVPLYKLLPTGQLEPLSTPDYSTILELVLENIRRSAFPSLPSRLQSYFAFTSLDEVKEFRQKQPDPAVRQKPIYRLEADNVFRADQAWLRLGLQNAIGSYCIHKFWSGDASQNPKWEHLLIPPVRVVDQIP